MRALALFALVLPFCAHAGDDALRGAAIGTWLYEQDAGVASVAMYTTYRADGTAIQLLKTKFIFKQARGIWIENRWRIQDGALHLTPIRYRADADDARIDLEEAVRRALTIDDRHMRYELKGKERRERKVADIPDDVQAMIDRLSKG